MDAMQAVEPVSDVICGNAVIAVRGIKSATATYRCAKAEGLVIGAYSNLPFIPWPDYTEGQSTELPLAMKRILADAKTYTADETQLENK